jgi:hypothetical protein
MADESKRWPHDPMEGARLILDALHALLTGPGAVAYLKPGMDGSARLMAAEALDDAERMAASAFERSSKRREAAGPAHFFTQGETLHRDPMPSGIEWRG